MLGSTKLTFTQSCSSTLDGCLVGAIPIRDVCAKESASTVMASRVSAERVGLIMGPEGIGCARTALDFCAQDGVRGAAASAIL
jgi:hypothetical protein